MGARILVTTSVVIGAVFAALLSASSLQASDNFIGAERCGSCHQFEYERWRQGPHARAHQSLSDTELRDPKCSTCHTPAGGGEAGSSRATFAAVQCETCHGGGKYYHFSYVMKDRELSRALGLLDASEATCKQCHSESTPSIEPFDFAKMWKRIEHSRAAKQAWEKRRGGAKTTSAKP